MLDEIDAPIWYGQCEHLRLYNTSETTNWFKAFGEIIQGFKLTYGCYRQAIANDPSRSMLSELVIDSLYHANVGWNDLAVVLLLAFIWTVLRWFFVERIFLPLAKWLLVFDKNLQKFGESSWKTVAYAGMWSTAVYITFYRDHDFFTNTASCWSDVTNDRYHWDLYIIYAIECSFYVHSIYATLYMDPWRKDSIAMLSHHFVTLWLVAASYVYSMMKIGIIIFVLDDISDIILESGKVTTYLRDRKEGASRLWSKIFHVYSDIGSVLFAVQWIVLRLYYHITKAWWTATYQIWDTLETAQPTPVHLLFQVFLGCLYVLYVYWFFFIVQFVVRVFTTRNFVDTREFDDDKKDSKKAK